MIIYNYIGGQKILFNHWTRLHVYVSSNISEQQCTISCKKKWNMYLFVHTQKMVIFVHLDVVIREGVNSVCK